MALTLFTKFGEEPEKPQFKGEGMTNPVCSTGMKFVKSDDPKKRVETHGLKSIGFCADEIPISNLVYDMFILIKYTQHVLESVQKKQPLLSLNRFATRFRAPSSSKPEEAVLFKDIKGEAQVKNDFNHIVDNDFCALFGKRLPTSEELTWVLNQRALDYVSTWSRGPVYWAVQNSRCKDEFICEKSGYNRLGERFVWSTGEYHEYGSSFMEIVKKHDLQRSSHTDVYDVSSKFRFFCAKDADL